MQIIMQHMEPDPNTNIRNRSSPQRALKDALRSGYLDQIKLLLADPTVSLTERDATQEMQTPLMLLCYAHLQEAPNTAPEVLEAVPNKDNNNEGSWNHYPSLAASAAQTNSTTCINTTQDIPPRMENGVLQILKMLDCHRVPSGEDLDTPDAEGRTLAMHACASHNKEILHWAMARGCTLTARDRRGMNVLHHAVLSSEESLVGAVLAYPEALLAIRVLDSRGYSPLDLARQRRLDSVVKMLNTALQKTAANRSKEMAEPYATSPQSLTESDGAFLADPERPTDYQTDDQNRFHVCHSTSQVGFSAEINGTDNETLLKRTCANTGEVNLPSTTAHAPQNMYRDNRSFIIRENCGGTTSNLKKHTAVPALFPAKEEAIVPSLFAVNCNAANGHIPIVSKPQNKLYHRRVLPLSSRSCGEKNYPLDQAPRPNYADQRELNSHCYRVKQSPVPILTLEDKKGTKTTRTHTNTPHFHEIQNHHASSAGRGYLNNKATTGAVRKMLKPISYSNNASKTLTTRNEPCNPLSQHPLNNSTVQIEPRLQDGDKINIRDEQVKRWGAQSKRKQNISFSLALMSNAHDLTDSNTSTDSEHKGANQSNETFEEEITLDNARSSLHLPCGNCTEQTNNSSISNFPAKGCVGQVQLDHRHDSKSKDATQCDCGESPMLPDGSHTHRRCASLSLPDLQDMSRQLVTTPRASPLFQRITRPQPTICGPYDVEESKDFSGNVSDCELDESKHSSAPNIKGNKYPQSIDSTSIKVDTMRSITDMRGDKKRRQCALGIPYLGKFGQDVSNQAPILPAITKEPYVEY